MKALVDIQQTVRHFCFSCNIFESFPELGRPKWTL